MWNHDNLNVSYETFLKKLEWQHFTNVNTILQANMPLITEVYGIRESASKYSFTNKLALSWYDLNVIFSTEVIATLFKILYALLLSTSSHLLHEQIQDIEKINIIGYIKTWSLRITKSSTKVISVHEKGQMRTGFLNIVSPRFHKFFFFLFYLFNW